MLKRNFTSMSTGGFVQAAWSPCRVAVVPVKDMDLDSDLSCGIGYSKIVSSFYCPCSARQALGAALKFNDSLCEGLIIISSLPTYLSLLRCSSMTIFCSSIFLSFNCGGSAICGGFGVGNGPEGDGGDVFLFGGFTSNPHLS